MKNMKEKAKLNKVSDFPPNTFCNIFANAELPQC